MKADDPSATDEFSLGPLEISISRRRISGPHGTANLQPQVMLVLRLLAEGRDTVVTRQALFDACWHGIAVGDDSLNRLLSMLRQALEKCCGELVQIETIPRTGYVLTVNEAAGKAGGAGTADAVEAAIDCWRTGLPNVDEEAIADLSAALERDQENGAAWGTLALLVRKGAEYADEEACSTLVSQCERAARRALNLQPGEPGARVALAGLKPLYGNWVNARKILTQVLEDFPEHPPALHELAVLEMATGRVEAAAGIIAQAIERDPLGAVYYYKRMLHLWCLDDLNEAERVAQHAVALWPRHPAIWMARFWILVFTGRADAAVAMIEGEGGKPSFPAPVLAFLGRTAAIVARGATSDRDLQVADARKVAAVGPANGMAALLSLCALGATDDAFDVAEGYYVGRRGPATPMRASVHDPNITDQHRRVTQALFLPATAAMRADPRFPDLCEKIGLTRYWSSEGITPDHLAKNEPSRSGVAGRIG